MRKNSLKIFLLLFIVAGCTPSKPVISIQNIKKHKITMKEYAKQSLFIDKEYNNVYGASKTLYATQNNYNFLLTRRKNIINKYSLLCNNSNAHIEKVYKKNPTLSSYFSDIHKIKTKKYTNIISTNLVPNLYHRKLLNNINNNSIYINGTSFQTGKKLNYYTCKQGNKRLFDYTITPIYYDLVKTIFNHKNVTGEILKDKDRAVWLGLDEAVYIY